MRMDVFWLEQRLADLPVSDEWLSRREIERLRAFKVPKRRSDWRLGRWTAKQAVASLLGNAHDLAHIEIVAEASGEPTVALPNEIAGLAISLTHCAGVAACAVVEHGVVGCDIEVVAERGAAFLADYFTSQEQALIASAGAESARMATVIWSAKESALKAVREGLRRDTRSVYVSRIDADEPSTWSALTVRCDTGEVFEGWWCEADGLVRNLLAAPAPSIPVPLDIAAYVMV